jgi:hypothetical protein
MIFGEYPCCSGDLNIAMPDTTPAYAREECPHCGAVVWHKLSRIQSTTWIESDFLELYTVDAETRKITEKNPAPEPPPEQNMIMDIVRRAMPSMIVAEIMGVGVSGGFPEKVKKDVDNDINDK